MLPIIFASSTKSVGSFRFWKCSQSVILRNFYSISRFESIGLSHSQFGLVVKTFNNATEELPLRFKPNDD